MGMIFLLLSDSSVCPHVHKGGEKSNSVSWIFLSFCVTRSPRDDHISMHVYRPHEDSHVIIHYGNEDMRETCVMETHGSFGSLILFHFLTQ